MSGDARRLLACLAAPAAALAAVGAPAQAATVRTDRSPEQIRAEYASGAVDRDIAAVYRRATAYVRAQVHRPTPPRRPAVVLDIDETTLSNYGCLDAVDFDLGGLATCAVEGRSRAIPAARRFVRFAQAHGVAVYFVTGAPEAICGARRKNLRAQGIGGRFKVICRPPEDTNDSPAPFKTAARRDIRRTGRTIVANVGDQPSDLSGGIARRAFRLPNPIYLTP